MHVSFRSACSLLSALAVLVVSATCSSAGCVLQLGAAASPAAPEASCCAAAHQQQHDSHQAPQRRDTCPLCQNPFLIGKTVDNAQSLHVVLLTNVLFTPLIAQQLDSP